MRALTLTQPWCALMAAGVKLVENRSRAMIRRDHIGQPVVLHASREIDEAVWHKLKREWLVDMDAYKHARTTSAVLAVATLAGIVASSDEHEDFYSSGSMEDRDQGIRQRQWFFGPIGYILRDVVALREPVPCRGWQGFWALPPEIEQRVRAQLVETKAA